MYSIVRRLSPTFTAYFAVNGRGSIGIRIVLPKLLPKSGIGRVA